MSSSNVRLRLALSLLLSVSIGTAWPAAWTTLPDSVLDDGPAAGGTATVVLAGGCFWGMEEVFEHVRGVTAVVSGYAGGSKGSAHYDLVSSGTTGHAESVQITYDPARVSFGQLLKVFFAVAHDPTQRNGQGPDIGPQYRSVIFYASDRQQQIAKAYLDQLRKARVFPRGLTTAVTPLKGFYAAEQDHQDYAARHPRDRYIVLVDLPKLNALQAELPALYVRRTVAP
jgi:peptide-methionine (S)-S-oxide reductase